MLILPPPLQPSDRVRVVAPSGCFDAERLAAGLELVRAAGLEPVFDAGLFETHRYLAGTDERRLAELDQALGDESVRAIWVARGGYGATRLLDRLDAERVCRAGKWLIGFSDVTALHALWARAGLASLHAANVTTLVDWGEQARAELFAVLSGRRPPVLDARGSRGDAPVTGLLLGGNLTLLAAMAGTGKLPSMAGAVLLLEDVGEKPYRLDRSLTQLRQAGLLDGAVGFVVGQLSACIEPGDSQNDYDALDVVTDELATYGLPILTGVEVGHEASSRPVLHGGTVTLDPLELTLTPVLPPGAAPDGHV